MNEVFEHLLADMDRHAVPHGLRPGLAKYLVGGIRPGSYLSALLSGDTRLAVMRADWRTTLGDLRSTLQWIETLPVECRGTSFETWIENPHHELVAAEMFDA